MSNIDNHKSGTAYPFLDTRRPLANPSLWPVRISVNIKGQQFRIAIKLNTTKEIFEKAVSGRGTMPKEAKIIKEKIDFHLEKAKTILKNYPNANKDTFLKLFKSEADLTPNKKLSLTVLFQRKMDELVEEDRIGSMRFYEQALLAFTRFRKNPCLEDIDVSWLKSFRTWYVNKGNSYATAQIYLRCLRHIYNRAIKDMQIAVGLYPFKEYTIGTASKSKDVLYPEQIKKLLNYETDIYAEKRAKDFWFFLYLSSGMNVKDALHLKGSNLKGDVITFVRSKTSQTKSDVEEIIVYLHPMAKEILQKWGSINTKDYLFPCLRGSKTEMERDRRKNVFARLQNRALRDIGKKLGFEMYLTLNLARHSFATKLNIDGVDTSAIQRSLGHSSPKTTEHYMKTLPIHRYKQISDNLLDFSKEEEL